MPDRTGGLTKQIRKWVVNDCFTPNIKAEVILDTLLTPYSARISGKRVPEDCHFKLEARTRQ